jgi:hypothetical protein
LTRAEHKTIGGSGGPDEQIASSVQRSGECEQAKKSGGKLHSFSLGKVTVIRGGVPI